MTEITELIRQIGDALKHADIIVLGAMGAMFIIGFSCGVLAYEIHCIKHQIKMHRYHTRRRGI